MDNNFSHTTKIERNLEVYKDKIGHGERQVHTYQELSNKYGFSYKRGVDIVAWVRRKIADGLLSVE